MHFDQPHRLALKLSTLALFAASYAPTLLASPDVTEPSDPQPSDQQIVVVRGVADGSETETEDQTSPKLWLGVQIKEIEGDLASFLGDQSGVFVESVFPGGPAEEAGLRKGDILTLAGNTKLSSPKQLLDVIFEQADKNAKTNDTGTPSLELTILRHGETRTVGVTLAPRPQAEKLADADAVAAIKAELQNLQDLKLHVSGSKDEMDELMKKLGKERFNVLRLGGPAIVLDQDLDQDELETESNINVTIVKSDGDETIEVTVTKNGDEPAKVTCKRGDETEDHYGDDLSQLPADVKKLVEPILNGKSNVRMLSGDAAELKQFSINDQAMLELVARVTQESAESRAKADQARASVRARWESDSSSSELAALRATVEKLKAELQELREQLKMQLDKGVSRVRNRILTAHTQLGA